MNKETTHLEQHLNIRKEFWCNVYIAYVGASNSTSNDGACKWADIALQRFDERFIRPEVKQADTQIISLNENETND